MQNIDLNSLLQDIRSDDYKVRAAARDAAGTVGAQALVPLAEVCASDDFEIARAARRAVQNIVYHAGRPGADAEAQAVAAELLKLLQQSQPEQFQRDLLWMTWQIAGEEAVDTVAGFLTHPELGEDARMTLERLPGDQATVVLKTALANAPDGQKPALAYSLRVRGVPTPGIPDVRLIPTKETSVLPVGS